MTVCAGDLCGRLGMEKSIEPRKRPSKFKAASFIAWIDFQKEQAAGETWWLQDLTEEFDPGSE